MLEFENRFVAEVVSLRSALYQDHDLLLTVARLRFHFCYFSRHKHCAVKRFDIFTNTPLDVGHIRLVSFTKRDDWPTSLDGAPDG